MGNWNPFQMKIMGSKDAMLASLFMEYWIDGMMERWNVGRMEEWKNGRMEEWKNGPSTTLRVTKMECWTVGILE